METTELKLEKLIGEFLQGRLSCELFEEQFSMTYDFEEMECSEQLVSYFTTIRELLERYTFSKSDLKNYPDHYIDCSKLTAQVRQLNANFNNK